MHFLQRIRALLTGHDFYIGQRVKIIACDWPPEVWVVGQEGIVNNLKCTNDVGWDGHIGLTVHGCPDWCFWPWELKPAEDDPLKQMKARKENEIA